MTLPRICLYKMLFFLVSTSEVARPGLMPITPRMMLRIVILNVPHHAWLYFYSYLGRLYSQQGIPTPPEWIATISRYCMPVSKMYNLVQRGIFMVHSRGGLSYLAGQMRSKLLRIAATGCRTSGTVHSTE